MTSMSRSPSKLPISTTTSHHYSASPALHSDLAAALTATRGAHRIESALRQALSASGWTDNLRTYCLDLLRRGECVTYDELMARVVRDARGGEESSKGSKDAEGVNGNVAVNGDAGGYGVGGTRSVEEGGVRIPQEVVKEGLRVVRRELDEVCEVVD
ncbi:MAG: hypothetical protein M1821_000144 [Bathelium mastoideum]|nr:MAG: hypothetical protein M1821_000144 [Bathelium mastoideum]KAI9687824.1 MAG: hypothetical protein M1822_001904 [Bathelium mastoideum]